MHYPLNTKNLDIRYITLASGLNFKVTAVGQGGDGVIEIDLVRYSKAKQSHIESRHIVTASGAYLPNGELNTLDVVSVSDGVNTYPTPAGLAHQKVEPQRIYLDQLNTRTKIQTRNGYWYNCVGAYLNQENGTYMLTLNQVGAESRIRNKIYDETGKHVSDFQVMFSPYDIVRIENLG